MFQLTAQPIQATVLQTQLKDEHAGALVTFEGWVRNHQDGRGVARLEYEAFEALSLSEGNRIIEEAKARFAIDHACCTHRIGILDISDMAVWVGVSSAHRDAAFQACRYIIDEIKARLPIWKKETYLDGSAEWVNCQQCAKHTHGHPEDQAAYYARQIILPEVGNAGQQKLSQSRVLVVGAGGLGSPALMYLAAAGVGTIGICDFDQLQMSNLHRQVLYTHSSIGEPKAQLAAERLQALNPHIHCTVHVQGLTAENAIELFSQYDWVLDCSDNFKTRFLLNDAAVLTKTPLIQASVYQYEGQIQHYHPASATENSTACLRCLWPKMPEADCVGTCADVGVLGVVPGFLGTLQAAECIKGILGLSTPLMDHLLLVNLLTYETQKIQRLHNPDCPACGEYPSITSIIPAHYGEYPDCEIAVGELAEFSKQGFQWIDIREVDECHAKPLPRLLPVAYQYIPLSEFSVECPPLDRGQTYLFVCQKGVRSGHLVKLLREQGWLHAYSLAGGISTLERQTLVSV